MGTAVKRGKVDALIAKALADVEIDEAELAEIIAAHRQHLSARHTEVDAVITLHRKQESRPVPSLRQRDAQQPRATKHYASSRCALCSTTRPAARRIQHRTRCATAGGSLT